ncbi:hypothetical protein K491DRAFT_691232 [Lophiostoma macrostomum CBS 122681]|uniref:Uncharacterized protein n=1 Tax=Lophiostoma macrostomum CBS 122681 TaxID=1314788 RepID=A0A6A6TDY8_9PLEO|nr:hypothetical protein K491DRAFT_691232 [Lophiostoma macrostomum CBS 122681]
MSSDGPPAHLRYYRAVQKRSSAPPVSPALRRSLAQALSTSDLKPATERLRSDQEKAS